MDLRRERLRSAAAGSELAAELELANSTIYPAINSLQVRGLVTVTAEAGSASQHKRNVRRFVAITSEGRGALTVMENATRARAAITVAHVLALDKARRQARIARAIDSTTDALARAGVIGKY